MTVYWKARKTMMLFSTLPTNLGNRSSRFPHSHRHDYDGILPKTSRLRDTHSEGKVRLPKWPNNRPVGQVFSPTVRPL
jgi:hypothetical protein